MLRAVARSNRLAGVRSDPNLFGLPGLRTVTQLRVQARVRSQSHRGHFKAGQVAAESLFSPVTPLVYFNPKRGRKFGRLGAEDLGR